MDIKDNQFLVTIEEVDAGDLSIVVDTSSTPEFAVKALKCLFLDAVDEMVRTHTRNLEQDVEEMREERGDE